MKAVYLRTGAAALALAFIASPAAAYIGPGLGLGAIGAVLGSIAAVFMVILGLIWYPFKIMLRKMRGGKTEAPATADTTASASQEAPPAANLEAKEDAQ
ncbi:MAG: hypothetical protein R3C60_01225 [Parvularculaceae bacterium]